MLKYLFNSLLLMTYWCGAAGQQAKQYSFSHYNTANGLASNSVNNVVQDQNGFIWLATINGLQRYDGHKFSSYKHQPGNPSTPPTDNITDVYLDETNKSLGSHCR